MKRAYFIILFLLLNIIVYGQDETTHNEINTYISYLGKPVPSGFRRLDRQLFTNENNVNVAVDNNVVINVAPGIAVRYINEAVNWLSRYYNYFEAQQDWECVYDDTSITMYTKDDIIIFLNKPERRDDGLIAANVIITKYEYLHILPGSTR